MDPHYRLFFKHVWPFCWPWLWWNLVRLTEWRRRTGRNVFVVVDKLGNVYIQYVGDIAGADRPYTYQPPKVRAWERLAPGNPLPEAEPFCMPLSAGNPCRERIIYSGTYSIRTRAPPARLSPANGVSMKSIPITGRPPPRRPHVLVTA
ncbi:hypothetical protein HY29_09195 [Hyphomonas beringensis]|uniref:Uncharacterized protein n=1 Tax=Hyphomonas beringensis TaxID=1280946 RepID=A0A062UEV2_9PROT|nr:hypothetical protein [Hyphomonas beringensis]KCZ56218.1 hypothetical protein HY29_09195 [Hyphomonas beringensis]